MRKSDITLVLIVLAGILTFVLPPIYNIVIRFIDGNSIIGIAITVSNIFLFLFALVFPVTIIIFTKTQTHLKHLLVSMIGISFLGFINIVFRNLIFSYGVSNGVGETVMILINVLYVGITVYAIVHYIMYIQIETETIVNVSLGIILFFVMINVPIFQNFLVRSLFSVSSNTYLIYTRIMSVIRLGLVALKAISAYKIVRREEILLD